MIDTTNQSATDVVAPEQTARTRTGLQKWLLLALLSLTVWGVSGFLMKLGSARFSPAPMQILFTLGTVPLFVYAWLRSRREPWGRKSGVAFGMLTGMITALGNVSSFAALQDGKASIVTPTIALFPMITFVLALVLLKEWVTRIQCVGVLLAIGAFVLLAQ